MNENVQKKKRDNFLLPGCLYTRSQIEATKVVAGVEESGVVFGSAPK